MDQSMSSRSLSSMPDEDWPFRKISEPHETNDVILELCHGGASNDSIYYNDCKGNDRLLEMIQSRKTDHDNKSRMEKPLVAVEIMKQWRMQTPPGRFLVVEENSSPPLWKDVGDKKARNYISKLLKHYHDNDNNVEHLSSPTTTKATAGEKKVEYWRSAQHSSISSNLDWRGVADRLYEREEQVQKLKEALERNSSSTRPSAEHQSEIVLIIGPSGSGKSELAKSMEDIVAEEYEGFFILGKFDQLRKNDGTSSALFAAFQQYTRLLKIRGKLWVDQKRKAIHASVGPEARILVEAMPFLGDILEVTGDWPEDDLDGGSKGDGTAAGTEKSMTRFIVAFRRFVRAILDPQHPIVLVLDDCQWADEGSLDVLQSIFSPDFGSRQGLLIIGTCRGNEVSVNDPLSVLLRNLEANGTTITNIEVENLSVETLNQMIVDAGVPMGRSSTLAEIVHSQTRGNAFFSTQFLRNLQEEGLLKRDGSDSEWEWDKDELQLSSRSSLGYDGQIVRLLAKRMMELPSEVQEVLKVAACIGGEVRENLLIHACNVSSSTVLLALSATEERGVIEYNFDAGVGRFSHDKFQEAAFSLIPEDERGSFQLRIGRTLRSRLSEKEFSDSLLLIASLMAQGMDQIKAEDEREKLARLCLVAARKSAKASAYYSAIQFVDYGLSLLTPRHWRDQYELSLLLYSTGAELAYCNGDHDSVDRLSLAVFENARNFPDQIHAYTSLILALDSRMQLTQATQVCLNVLKMLGQRFPRKAGKLGIFLDFSKTRRMLRGKTARDILSLPTMTDEKALISMSILHLFYPIVLLNNFSLSPLAAFRLVQLTLQHGLSSMSSVGFAFYASVLVRRGEIDEGSFYADVALKIMEKLPVKGFEGRTLIATYGNVKTEVEPLRACLDPYIKAHNSALSTGDFSSAEVALYCHCMMTFFIGEPLDNVVNAIIHAKGLSLDYGQRSLLVLLDPLLQACYNLMGRSADCLALDGEAMNEKDWKESSFGIESMISSAFAIMIKLYLAIYMNDLESAKNLLSEYARYDLGCVIPYIFNYFIFYRGIVASSLSGKSPVQRWRARRYLQQLKKSMLRCRENYTNKVFFLLAELARSSGQIDKAAVNFDRAIKYAEQDGFLNEQAFACERAARMYLEENQIPESARFFNEAIQLYDRWGAKAKVYQLKGIMAEAKLEMSA